MISLDHVCVSFGGLRAVDDVSFAVDSGKITGLIGPNGAGKSTVFNVIAGHVPATSGRVLLEGEDITALKPHARAARGLARTFQIPHEFARLTVLENFMAAAASPLGENVFNAMFRRAAFMDEERAVTKAAQETVKLLELDRVRDERAGNLSGGQKKLIELGRALMRNPKIVLLDEIGAGINRTLLAKISDKIKLLNRERRLTFCLIEHDLDYVAKLCDSVVVMAQGSVLMRGTVDEVRRDERVIEAYFGGGKYEASA
jgi:branched-chain amino acid transport system ATP-binding protein